MIVGSVAKANTCRCLVEVLAAELSRECNLSLPPPRTTEQPQACSTYQSFMPAPDLRCEGRHQGSASAWLRQHALSIRVPEAERSAQLDSTSTSHRGAAASLLDHSELHDSSDAKANHQVLQVRVPGCGSKHSPCTC